MTFSSFSAFLVTRDVELDSKYERILRDSFWRYYASNILDFGHISFPAKGFLLIVSCLSQKMSLLCFNVDRIRIKAKLTNSSLHNLFLTRNCGDVSIVRINLWKDERQTKKLMTNMKDSRNPLRVSREVSFLERNVFLLKLRRQNQLKFEVTEF